MGDVKRDAQGAAQSVERMDERERIWPAGDADDHALARGQQAALADGAEHGLFKPLYGVNLHELSSGDLGLTRRPLWPSASSLKIVGGD